MVPQKTLWILFVLNLTGCATIFLLTGCASGDHSVKFGSEPEPPQDVQVDSAAYGADWMTFRKSMPVRPRGDDDFFFKRCETTSRRTFYSRTDYVCDYP